MSTTELRLRKISVKKQTVNRIYALFEGAPDALGLKCEAVVKVSSSKSRKPSSKISL